VHHAEAIAPDGASVPLSIFVPKQDAVSRPALLHIHGGGFVMGDARSESDWSAWLAQEINCIIVSPDYRLAPESPHPVPIEDCYAALAWLQLPHPDLSIDQSRMGVFGGSAGGGLAAALSLLARDRGGPPLRCQCLLFPMLDDRTSSMSDRNPYVGQFVWTAEDNEFGWSCLLGEEHADREISCYAAPARADDLGEIPATFIWVGALDLFLEESVAYASRLWDAGISAELHVFPGVTHGNILLDDCASTRQCRSLTLRFLKANL
jgi:triacylglycerol lipase